ncbi:zf-RING_2 domain-containing protein [Cephalotus follicularis]|uniref:RING-type E3 ubiquitin transferase n=1 Tax=Cephalotus follicularis TaxID=3775 RepID=A0A1Q3CZD4_CEPFO|nr:zf-RING_2 domain-containing protein [Cephalotus follicularis]
MHATNPPSADAVDRSPLLTHSLADHLLRSRRLLRRPPRPFSAVASRLLWRASSRRLMFRGPSVTVRETVTEQLRPRQGSWAYSMTVTVLDVMWNLAFVAVAVVVLGMSSEEKPRVPLRLWVFGYELQCLIHVVCVVVDYKRRRQGSSFLEEEEVGSGDFISLGPDSQEEYQNEQTSNENDTRIVKYLEVANTLFSFIWWIIGFYWVTVGGQTLTHDSPLLYWLCVTFLAFDVFFVVICVVVAGFIGIAVCCCLPCIIAILYTLTDGQEGATKEDIDCLPKYKFRRISDFEKANCEIEESVGGIMTECNTDMPIEQVLSEEDAECRVCLSAYDDDTELRELPCCHHFHCTCIDKWLSINAICPLCKFNILKSGDQSGHEEV